MHTVKVITIHTALDAVYYNMAHVGTANMQVIYHNKVVVSKVLLLH